MLDRVASESSSRPQLASHLRDVQRHCTNPPTTRSKYPQPILSHAAVIGIIAMLSMHLKYGHKVNGTSQERDANITNESRTRDYAPGIQSLYPIARFELYHRTTCNPRPSSCSPWSASASYLPAGEQGTEGSRPVTWSRGHGHEQFISNLPPRTSAVNLAGEG
jgi:hypothetical protein